jgi:alanyl-tRNA synthetase
LNVKPEGISDKFKSMASIQKQLEKQVAEFATKLAVTDLGHVLQTAVEVQGVKVVSARVELDSPQTLRELGDRMRDSMGSGVAVLGGVIADKVVLLAIVSKDLTEKISAGVLVGKVAAMVGGKGGGRSDMAQAGGPMTDKLNEAIAFVHKIVQNMLAR